MFMCTNGWFRDAPWRHAAKRCPVVFALILLPACTFAQERPRPIHSDFVIAIERDDDVPPGQVFMKPVAGGFLGHAENVELYRSTTNAGHIEVALDALTADIAPHAVLARSDDTNPGELANPRELGIVRIATFYQSEVHAPGCNNFRTGLRAEWPMRAMLVYVDRAGVLRGSRYTPPYIMEYDLEFPEAGLYAVAMQVRGPRVTQRVLDADQALVVQVRRSGCEERGSRQAAH